MQNLLFETTVCYTSIIVWYSLSSWQPVYDTGIIQKNKSNQIGPNKNFNTKSFSFKI